MNTPPPGTGYFTGPTDSPGPGVLFLHGPMGLTSNTKAQCDGLADLGFTVLAPDLADGELPETEDEAWQLLRETNMNVLASLIPSSGRLLQNAAADSAQPLGVVGFSSGASWALWLSARHHEMVGPVVTYYGTQEIDLGAANAEYLCHFAEADEIVSEFETADLGLRLQQANRPFRFAHHEGTRHGFAEADFDSFDAAAEVIAWRQTTEFLAAHLLR